MAETETEKQCRTLKSSGTEKSFFEDEALEVIWELMEKGEVNSVEVIKEMMGNEEGVLKMEADGLVNIKEGKICFTGEGEKRARDITRRHRLAERLFADVLDLKEYEDDACLLEHAISPDVEEAICTFLGHPPTCPHGKPIPKGRCCSLFTQKVQPLVQRLTDIDVGSSGRVVFINTPLIDRLSAMGLIAGAIIKLLQKMPSYVIQIDETVIAIDKDVAKDIYTKTA